MKKLTLLSLALLLTTTTFASTRNWKQAKIDVSSETSVSSKLLGEKNTMHYTIETEEMIYFVEYVFKPGHADSHPPNLTETEITKIAVEGHHVYVLDVAGKEIKMHIIKKVAKK
jgi:hypothetical protein